VNRELSILRSKQADPNNVESKKHVDNNRPREPLYKISTPLEGNIQTVPRPELTAVLITVQNIEYNGRIDFFTDSQITRDTYYKGKERARLANHEDL